MLKLTTPVIKQANSSAYILTTGLAPASTSQSNYKPTDFLKGIYQNGGKDYFDGVAMHPYSSGMYPDHQATWNAWQQMDNTFGGTQDSLRSVMITNGDEAKKIWATEYGIPTGGTDDKSVSQSEQALILKKAFELWKTYPWAAVLTWYNYKDVNTGGSSIHDNYGLTKTDGTPKESLAMYRQLMSDFSISPTATIAPTGKDTPTPLPPPPSPTPTIRPTNTPTPLPPPPSPTRTPTPTPIPPTPTRTPTPTPTPLPPPPTATPTPTQTPQPQGVGLLGSYYRNSDFTLVKYQRMPYQRIDSMVDFNWEYGSPVGVNGTNSFAVRWTGFITIKTPGAYLFYTRADDGTRLRVNNKLIVDDWGDHSAR